MQLTKYIILFTVLILTTLVKSSNAETTCTENELGDQTCITTTTTTTGVAGVTTENLLSSNFNDGSWTHTNQQFHGDYMFATTGESTSSSTVSLTDDAGLSKTQINAGFSSTLSANIWFWSGVSSKVTLRQTLTDDNGNVITQYRDITGTSGNLIGTDTIIVGSNTQQNYNITASIQNITSGYSSSSHIGPDINNPSLIVTTNDTYQTSTTSTETFTYCYDRVPNACTYDNEALEEIADFKTDTGQTYDDFIEEQVNTVNVEEFTIIEKSFIVEDDLGNVEELTVEEFAVETFETFIETNNLTETFETALVEENITEEEFFDEMANELEQEFSNDLTEDTVEEETVQTETDTTDLKESNDTTTETEVEENTNQTNTESETSENVSNESDVDKNTETEGTETETNNEETVETTTNTDVETDSGTSINTRSIEEKVERVIAKVLKKLKSIDKKLQAVQFITTQGITAGQADISGYINKRVYTNQKQIPDVPFYSDLNILEQQQIYADVSLQQYTSNDLIGKKQKQLLDVQEKINRIQAELYALREKRG